MFEQTLVLGRRTANIPLQDRCLAYLCITHRRRGDLSGVERYLPEAFDSAATEDKTMYVAVARAHEAWLALQHNQLDRSRELARKAMDTWRGLGATYPLTWLAGMVLLACAAAQNLPEEGRTAARQMLDTRQQQLPEPVAAALEKIVSSGEGEVGAAMGPFRTNRRAETDVCPTQVRGLSQLCYIWLEDPENP